MVAASPWLTQSAQVAQRRESRQPPRANNREPVASSMNSSAHKRGERIFHQKFGYGRIDVIDGNKLTVSFEKAGIKKVLDSYVEKP